jgi:chorismate-pyruvate lyase
MMVPMKPLHIERMRSEPCDRPSRSATGVLSEALAGLQVTVTEFIEDLVNEPLFADKVEQFEMAATSLNRLFVEPGLPLMRRATLLRGKLSSREYVYAETSLVPSRLPSKARERLKQSSDPIGRIIVDCGVRVRRVNLALIDPAPGCPSTKLAREFIYARRYRIDVEDQPAMDISEWFLPDLAEFLVRLR